MSEIRRQARQRRTEIGLEPDRPAPAEGVVAACLSALGLERSFVSPEDPMLAGAMAVLDLTLGLIIQDETRTLPQQSFDAAHEIAHVWLHGDSAHGGPCSCTPEDLDLCETAETPGSALSKVDGYSRRQRRENEANVFAAELLLPGSLARTLFLDEKLGSEAIAGALGLPGDVVQAQLAESLLLPPLPEHAPETKETPASAAVELDPSQREAAEIQHGPLLVGAGPGTGKTKTLVGRCQYLTQARGVPAEKILALTFSRKAASEMKERLLAAGVGTENAGPWVGTFHAFGLEILRRFGDRIGLSGEIKLLDTLDAVTLLENHLVELHLNALDNLYNPAIHLGGILRQIGRAKDERCRPERYAALCRAMRTAAEAADQALAARPGKVLKREQEAVDKGLEQAQKAEEVAHCYAVYERLMAANGFLDFGDLIRCTTELLENHPDVLAMVRAEYPQVLADEYQDVNRACAYLVRLLAGADARGLWAVGDHRQSIYQFQGASPANIAAFERDYPSGRRLELGINYRSRRPIVELFGGAAQSGVKGFQGWSAHRGDAEGLAFPAVTLAVAPDDAGQAQGIAEAIEALRGAGWRYQNQAVLCRTHAQAEALAGLLSAQNIPVLYLGALLERPEVKDLLCLLSLLADPDGSALVRVAAWPEYGVPQAEALTILAQVRREETRLLDALGDPSLHPGLARLGRHLAALDTMDDDPAALLRHYLFGMSDYLRHPASGNSGPLAETAQRLALHQLLGLAAGFDKRLVSPSTEAGPPSRVRAFLSHLRRLVSAGAGPRGTLPPESEALDAVRILTAHAAKGLEFPVVFVPNLGAGQFPARGRHDGIPEPPGLVENAAESAEEELDEEEMDEERCLFFVALSRAREHLILSRAETSGSERAVAPSPLLACLGTLPETIWPAGREPASDLPPDGLAFPPSPLPEHSQSALETYFRCPRQYWYAHVLKLPGAFLGGGYPQFLSCVRQALNWQEEQQGSGEIVTEDALAAKLEALWEAHGPVGHLHEAKYKAAAYSMLQSAAQLETGTERKAGARTLKATLSNCRVSVRPDVLRVDNADGGSVVVARRLTGKPGKDDHTDKRLALYRRAAAETHPDKPVRIALHYLADGVSVPIDAPETKQQIKWEEGRVAKYENAARGIYLGLFGAETGDECAKCAYGLLCPE